jgi:signal transduction histidine kinase
MENKAIRILLIEDNPGHARLLQKALSKADSFQFQVKHCELLGQALQCSPNNHDVIMLDLTLPDSTGMDTLRQISTHMPDLPIIVLTSIDDEALAIEAAQLGAQDYLVKGEFDESLLVRTIQYALERKLTEQALRDSSQFLQSALDSLTANIAILDDTGLIVAVNEGWRRYADENGLNWPDYGVGRNYLAVLEAAADVSEESRLAAEGIHAIIAGRRDQFQMEYPCHSPWEKRWYVLRLSRFESRGRIWVVTAHENVTERRSAEEAMREAKEAAERARKREEERRQEAERRQQIAESLRGILSILNSARPLEQVLDYITVQARQLLDSQAVAIYPLQKGQEKPSAQIAQGTLVTRPLDTEDIQGHDILKQAILHRRPIAIPDTTRREPPTNLTAEARSPSALWAGSYVALLAVPIVVREEVYGGMLLGYEQPRSFSSEDIQLTVIFADQVALAIENARLRKQAEHAAATAERNRLARDLHDAVTQTLFSASLIAEALPRVWESHPEQGQHGLGELRRLTRGALAEMRNLLLELRPAALIEKPFPDLLENLVESVTSRTRVPVSLEIAEECPLPPEVQIAFYRIAQEAFNNVVKHARASQVEVFLDCQPDQVQLRIRDNGNGFDPSATPAGRMGLGIMRERAANIGATLKIETQSSQGTEVALNWPRIASEEDE